MARIIAAALAAILFVTLGGCATTKSARIDVLKQQIADLEDELKKAKGWEGAKQTPPSPPSEPRGGEDSLVGEGAIGEGALYHCAFDPADPFEGQLFVDRMPPGRTKEGVIEFFDYDDAGDGPLLIVIGNDLPSVPLDWRAPPAPILLANGEVARLPLLPSGSRGYVVPPVRWDYTQIWVLRFRGDAETGYALDCVNAHRGPRVERPWGEQFTDSGGCDTRPETVKVWEGHLRRLRVPGT